MSDLHALYVVTAIVVAGLATWDLVVLRRADRLDAPAKHADPSPDGKPAAPIDETGGPDLGK
jgi:hypothetical protein